MKHLLTHFTFHGWAKNKDGVIEEAWEAMAPMWCGLFIKRVVDGDETAVLMRGIEHLTGHALLERCRVNGVNCPGCLKAVEAAALEADVREAIK